MLLKMDRPKLTLVKTALVEEGNNGGGGRNIAAENEWFIDACDLEGVDMEEVEDEGNAEIERESIVDQEEEQWATECEDATNNFDEENEKKVFGFVCCTECNSSGCTRPVQEICGHVKCRDCYMSSEDCKQCSSTSNIEILEMGNDQDASNDVGAEPGTPASDCTSNDIEERVLVKPNEYIFELGEASGTRSLAVVSSETLKQLGIQDPNCQEAYFDDKEIISANSDVVEPTETEFEDAATDSEVSTSRKSKRKHVLLTDHIILVSGSPQKYKCLVCKKDFMTEYQRKYHIFCNSLNGRRPYICHCREEFISYSHYMYHVRKLHTGEKPYICPVCSTRFIQKVKLNRHMITHTSSKPKPHHYTKSSAYLCAYCKKRFTTLSSCKRHIKNHTEEKPFKCNSCEKTFKQKYSLEIHERTHLQERPYECPDCDKAFSTAKDMRRHHLIHTGELPFICAFAHCQAKFRRKDNLERHIRHTHKLSDKMAKLLGNEAAKKYLEDKQLSNHVNGNSNETGYEINEVVQVITGL